MLKEGEDDCEKAIELCKWKRVRSSRNNFDNCNGSWAVSGNNAVDEVTGVSERDLGSHFGKPHKAWLQAI
jgi:hypothetical protein